MSNVKLSVQILLLLILISVNFTVEASKVDCVINDDSHNLSDWHHQYKEQCYFLGKNNPINENTDTIKVILSEMKKEPVFAKYLLDKAAHLNTSFCIENRADGCRGYFDYGYNIIAVRSKLDLFTKVTIFIHELRHVDQLSRGYSRSLDYDAKEIGRLIFAIEADANAVLALYAWKLKQNGYPQVWNKLFELSKYSDIYDAFQTEILLSKDEIKASRKAFVQWYKSDWRTTGYFRNSTEGYFDMLDETNLIQKYNKLPGDYFDKLCLLPDGRNYGCHLTDEIKTYQKYIQ